MTEELIDSLESYQRNWQGLLDKCHQRRFFEALRPIAVGWKVADKSEFDQRFPSLQAISNRVHCSWLDGRWLGSFHPKETMLPWNIRHIKLMQRRPQSTDALGLDHVDFLLPDGIDIENILRSEPGLSWTREKGDLTEWISLRFDNTEAKLRFADQTSLDAIIGEWQIIKEESIGRK